VRGRKGDGEKGKKTKVETMGRGSSNMKKYRSRGRNLRETPSRLIKG